MARRKTNSEIEWCKSTIKAVNAANKLRKNKSVLSTHRNFMYASIVKMNCENCGKEIEFNINPNKPLDEFPLLCDHCKNTSYMSNIYLNLV